MFFSAYIMDCFSMVSWNSCEGSVSCFLLVGLFWDTPFKGAAFNMVLAEIASRLYVVSCRTGAPGVLIIDV